MQERSCIDCGASIAYGGRGQPPKRCEGCKAAARKAYYQEHRAERIAAVRAWGVEHPEKVREYRRRNKDKVKAANRARPRRGKVCPGFEGAPCCNFVFHKSGSIPFCPWCKQESMARSIKRANNHPERKAKDKAWLATRPPLYRADNTRRYRFPGFDFDAQLAAQDGVCAICGTDSPGGRGRWRIDHDHRCCENKTGKTCGRCTRGLLCDLCNTGAGRFRDDPALLRKAAEYIEWWEPILAERLTNPP